MKKLILIALVSLAGCAVTHESSVVVGKTRPATSPDQVRLYTSPPKQFEEISIISADATHAFMQKQALMDQAILNAKKEAAKVGANGILIDGLGDYGSTSSGATTMIPIANQRTRTPTYIGVGGGSGASAGKQIVGKAIYVIEP